MFSGSVPRKATMTRSVSPSYAAKAWLSVAELCTHARTQSSDFLRYNVRFTRQQPHDDSEPAAQMQLRTFS